MQSFADILDTLLQPVVFALVSPVLALTWVLDRAPVVTLTWPVRGEA